MREFPKAWAASEAALLRGDASFDSELADIVYAGRPLDVPVEIAESRVLGWLKRRAIPFRDCASVLSAAAAGWATLAIAYCPWNLIPQSLQEFGVVLFGAVAGGAGALVMILHPEEHL
jgi:hypothetical protein